MEKQAIIPVLGREMFENNQIQEKSIKDEIVYDKTTPMKQNKKSVEKKQTSKSKRRCTRGRRRSKKTGRCRKNCAPGYKRSKTIRCVKE